MRARVVLVVAMLLVANACADRSRVDPNAEIHVRGDATAPNGEPVADRPVHLGTGIGTDTGVLIALSLGLVCAGGGCSGRVRDTTTDDAGHYEFVLKGRDTQSTFGQAVSVLVTVSGAPQPGQVSGPLAAARFRVQVPDVRLPHLDLVDPGLAVDGDDAVTARWATPKPGPYTLSFELAKQVPVWRTVVPRSPAAVDPRLLEDTSGRVVVAGTSDDTIEGSDVTLTWRSPGVAYVAGAGPPPSRGAPCRFMDAAGASTESHPCGLTDGDLTTATPASPVCAQASAAATTTTGCTGAAWAVVDLARPVPAQLLVVRGCDTACPVEVSDDGAAFRPAGGVADDFSAIGLDGRPIRSVRVAQVTPGGDLREVSVWGARPERPALRHPADDDEARLRRPFTGESDDEGARSWLLAVAAVLVAAALAAVAFALGRRRAGGPRLRA